MVADLAGTVQKAAQEMAEWGQEECAPAGWNKFQRDTAGLKHQIKGGCTHFAILEADLVCMVTGVGGVQTGTAFGRAIQRISDPAGGRMPNESKGQRIRK